MLPFRKVMSIEPSRPLLDVEPRRPYASPRLVVLGDLRSLTLGGSPGAGDSGVGAPRKPLVVGEAPFPPSIDEA
jgi:hypothetical protein